MRSSLPLVLSLVGFCGLGCSSSYKPLSTGRVAIVQKGGTPVLVRDGSDHLLGMFGGGLADAVEGVPLAEEYAESFRNRTIASFAMSLGGLAFTVSGATLMGAGFSTSGNRDAMVLAGSTLLTTGFGLVIAGMIFGVTAQPRLWDAINAYNDAVAPPLMPMPNWAPPPGYAGPVPLVPAPILPPPSEDPTGPRLWLPPQPMPMQAPVAPQSPQAPQSP